MVHQVTFEELYTDLYTAYFIAINGKSNKPYVIAFSRNLDANIRELAVELFERRYTPRPSTCFIVSHPKKREVFAADFRDRIVHHYIFMKTHILFERTFISDSYSCIEGRGTHYGIERLRHHIEACSENYTKPCYALKMDIKGYFMHIDRQLLSDITKGKLRKMATHQSNVKGNTWGEVIDIDFLCYLCHEVIMIDPTIDCIIKGSKEDWIGLPQSKSLFAATVHGKMIGMPIGNLTSQLFSNVLLSVFDDWMKRVMRCKRYGRYVDDFYVISCDKRWLIALADKAAQFLHDELHLDVNRGKTRIINVRYGVEFLGGYVKPFRTYISNQSLHRMMAQIPKLRHADPEHVFSAVNSDLGVLVHYASYHIRRQIVDRIDTTSSHCMVNHDYTKLIKW